MEMLILKGQRYSPLAMKEERTTNVSLVYLTKTPFSYVSRFTFFFKDYDLSLNFTLVGFYNFIL